MCNEFEPWTKYGPLTRERLSIIAEIIRRVRRETVLLHDPVAGDDEWSLGCRAYARICFALSQAATESDWLKIVPEEQPLRFTFAIDSIPIKFYHGEAGDPPNRYLTAACGEQRQQQLALIEGFLLGGQVLRLAVETDESRAVSAVTLVEMDEVGNVTGTYIIPFETKPANVTPLQAPEIELPPLTVGPLTPEAEKRKERDAR